ncbi:exodeoxyribonuclease V subunit alpha [Aquilutibacter rugosus]|uniref:exodeoxyribonuclease V subunit alpha n=1 Tax=Aquilutibacter rugosus TaxID=3115820 RepID=UPI002F42F7D2
MSAELIKAAAEPIARDALDLAVASWFRRLGAPAAVAELASWANYADRQANAAVSFQQVAQWSQGTALPSVPESEWILPAEEFDNSPVRPLVVDDQQRVFLYRNYAGEREVAAHLVARLQGTQAKPVKEEMITQLFGPAKGSEDALQREAVRRAARHRLFVLAGGPGTGKTTTVFRMLLAAQAQAVEVALAAPTGKAAQRLTEALRSEAGRSAIESDLETLRATTVHRWLIEMDRGQIRSPKILVIDEASMLDLELLRQVLQALDPDARLILVGDPNQLMSVGTGTVLGDLVESLRGMPQLVELQHNFRVAQSPQLVVLNQHALAGDAEALIEALDGLRDVSTRDALATRVDAWADALAESMQTVANHSDPAVRAQGYLELARHQQMLAANREGPWGVGGLNRAIESRLQKVLQPEVSAAGHFEGRRILVTQNHSPLNLFNGDIGVVTRDDSGEYQVWFEILDTDGVAQLRPIPASALPAHMAAWAMTIHKSQGSEFTNLDIVLPNETTSRVLSRQLIYTAVSRVKGTGEFEHAHQSIRIWGTTPVLAAGLAEIATRTGGLRDMLQSGLSELRAAVPAAT